MKKSSIFISYSSLDKDFVLKLVSDIKDEGHSVWLDDIEIQLGDSIIDRIRDGIDSMDYLGVVLSTNSLKSAWVKKEVDVSMNQEIENKRIKVIPILYEQCDPPWFLKGKAFADFSKPENYESSLKKVIKRLESN